MSETIITTMAPDTRIPPSRFKEAEDGWQEPIDAQPLPPVDSGKYAYRFLGAAFVIEGLVWGFPGSYGVLLEHYLHGPLGTTPGAQTLIPLVGTLNSGIMFLAAPLIIAFMNRYPNIRVTLMWTGVIIAVLCLITASFATQTWHLVLGEGVGYGIGGAFAYYPTISFMAEWFVERRGFANGVIYAGTAVGGLVWPFTLEFLLSRYNAPTTLRILGIFNFITLASVLPFIHSRVPTGGPNQARPSTLGNLGALRNSRFWVYMAANACQGLAYFLPGLYIPSYAQALALTPTQGSAALAAMNAAAVVSRLTMGALSDKFSPHIIGCATTILSSLSVFLIWGVASTSFPPLIIFGLCFGVFASGWSSLFMRICGDFSVDGDRAAAVTLYGFAELVRGVGNILSAPISASLLNRSLGANSLKGGYGTSSGEYGALIVFCGVMMIGAGLLEAVDEYLLRRRK